MQFVKANGTGNSFLFLDNREGDFENFSSIASSLCDPCYGIGADGVFFVEISQNPILDFKVRIFNADGSEADMCGNGIRCLHAYLYRNKISQKDLLNIETNQRNISTKLLSTNPFCVEANMGPPIFFDKWIAHTASSDLLTLQIENRTFGYVSMGNPHCITQVSDFAWDYLSLGETIEQKKDLFPQGTNVEFVKIISPQEIHLRVWERGCKETKACGTGACASVVFLTKLKKLLPNKEIIVRLLGGDLYIRWDDKSNSVFMRGECTLVCQGEVLL